MQSPSVSPLRRRLPFSLRAWPLAPVARSQLSVLGGDPATASDAPTFSDWDAARRPHRSSDGHAVSVLQRRSWESAPLKAVVRRYSNNPSTSLFKHFARTFQLRWPTELDNIYSVGQRSREHIYSAGQRSKKQHLSWCAKGVGKPSTVAPLGGACSTPRQRFLSSGAGGG